MLKSQKEAIVNKKTKYAHVNVPDNGLINCTDSEPSKWNVTVEQYPNSHRNPTIYINKTVHKNE
jgi:hypothetical protein